FRSRELIGRLARAVAESTDGAYQVHVEVEDIWLPQESAHCLALILNELLTNSMKHGAAGTGTIRISLEREGDQLRLVVRDDGPGYPDLSSPSRGSGLTLIRGLCRQIGGALELGNEGGARTVLTFTDGGVYPPQAAALPRHGAAVTSAAST